MGGTWGASGGVCSVRQQRRPLSRPGMSVQACQQEALRRGGKSIPESSAWAAARGSPWDRPTSGFTGGQAQPPLSTRVTWGRGGVQLERRGPRKERERVATFSFLLSELRPPVGTCQHLFHQPDSKGLFHQPEAKVWVLFPSWGTACPAHGSPIDPVFSPRHSGF